MVDMTQDYEGQTHDFPDLIERVPCPKCHAPTTNGVYRNEPLLEARDQIIAQQAEIDKLREALETIEFQGHTAGCAVNLTDGRIECDCIYRLARKALAQETET